MSIEQFLHILCDSFNFDEFLVGMGSSFLGVKIPLTIMISNILKFLIFELRFTLGLFTNFDSVVYLR